MKDVNIILGAVAPIPLKARAVEKYLEGKSITDETAIAAGDIAVRAVKPLSKNKFKVQVVKALLRKMFM